MEELRHKLIVSCQALPDEPLHSDFIMARMAVAAEEGGASGIRANSVVDIAAIRKAVNLPIIGIIKRDYEGADVYITATMKEVDELMTVRPDIIAIDATTSTRPNGESLEDFFQKVKKKYPDQLWMADCSTIDEMLTADQIGFDYIGTTLVGYTKQSKGDKIESNDFEIIRKALSKLSHPLIAEGNIDTPDKVHRVLELGAYSVVVGSAITRPQLITKKFVEATKERGFQMTNTNLKKYEGVIPAFYACYDENGEVSPERVRALTQYHIDKGVQGVYVNGSSGECIYLSVEDRKLILENVMAVAKGKLTVIAHVACNNTKDSVELAKHAESLGVDAIAAIPPIYFRLPAYSIARYWNDMSKAAPNTDFIIYNIPQLSGTTLTRDLYAEMRKNPRVIGVKNSSMPTQDIQMFVADGGDDHIVFNGPDEQFISGRVIGAKAGIGGTYGVMPDLFLKLNELIKESDFETAKELQYAINDVIYKMVSGRANLYAVIKEILRLNEKLDLGSVRAPLEPLHEEDLTIAKEAAELIQQARKEFL